MIKENDRIANDPLWYKDAVIYEVQVKTFFDSNNDGIGDLKGLTGKLDYLEKLGINAVWLLPFYPSPMLDDGYDIADYYNINPDYGSLKDFKNLLNEAHHRGIRIITELVINHTSNQHPWFQRARISKPGSIYRNYYVWSDTTLKYGDARIIFKDFEKSNWTWDPVAKSYYWHRFYSHQPDLNYENIKVQKEIFKVVDFWLGMGVDGLRLDAIPYLYEKEGTNCENLPETHEFLKKLRGYIDSKYKNRMLLAEANQWPEDTVKYFGKGDECHMAFHFPIMPQMYMAIQTEDSFPVIDIIEQTSNIPKTCQWTMFLRNHDELTLEMVTDEDRDYMYHNFAPDPQAKINYGIRRRLAPLLGNSRKKIEMMNILLLSLPGTPVIYYGDEIGMGDNFYLGDRDGVRTPMQWSLDRNAGFSKANPQKLLLPVITDPEYDAKSINVENQENNLSSLLWWMRRIIALRKEYKAFGRGSIKFITPENKRILAFIRKYKNEIILVVINLSRFTQSAAIDLSDYKGYIPEELYSRNRFPEITGKTYTLTIPNHSHFWLILKKKQRNRKSEKVPELIVEKNWRTIFEENFCEKLEKHILPLYLKNCPGIRENENKINRVKIIEKIPVNRKPNSQIFLILQIKYYSALPELYLLPVAYKKAYKNSIIIKKYSNSIITRLKIGKEKGIIYDCKYDREFGMSLLDFIRKRKKLTGITGSITAYRNKKMSSVIKSKLNAWIPDLEENNVFIYYGKSLSLELYRKLEEGINPACEIIEFIGNTSFNNIMPLVGDIEYRPRGKKSVSLGIMTKRIPKTETAWFFILDAVSKYFDYLKRKKKSVQLPFIHNLRFDLDMNNISAAVKELMGEFYIEKIGLLGKRTAEFHIALSSAKDNPDFVPERFSILYQRSLYQSLRNQVRRSLLLLQNNLNKLDKKNRDEAEKIIGSESYILENLKKIYEEKLSGSKIRIHGNYHLGQLVFTGKDFLIDKFTWYPDRPVREQRIKHSPLKDVAWMLRSFHYAPYIALFENRSNKHTNIDLIAPWIDLWFMYTGSIFLSSYRSFTKDKTDSVPDRDDEFRILLKMFMVQRSVHEVSHEIKYRPHLTIAPISGIKHIMNLK